MHIHMYIRRLGLIRQSMDIGDYVVSNVYAQLRLYNHAYERNLITMGPFSQYI